MDRKIVQCLLLAGVLMGRVLLADDLHVVAEADLLSLDGSGQPILSMMKYHLALSAQGGEAVSFTLSQGPNCRPGMMCPMFASIARVVKIVRQNADRCGSVHYLAYANPLVPSPSPRQPLYRAGTWLTLVDHTHRMCEDFHPYAWEVSVRDPGQKPLRLFGNPAGAEPKCADIRGNAACTMDYLPSTCQVGSVGGVSLPTPIAATGSNACDAKLNLEVALCEKSMDWAKMDDATCAVSSIHACPIPECAAPPTGCSYVSDPSMVDANGCPTGCGKLVCIKMSIDPIPLLPLKQ